MKSLLAVTLLLLASAFCSLNFHDGETFDQIRLDVIGPAGEFQFAQLDSEIQNRRLVRAADDCEWRSDSSLRVRVTEPIQSVKRTAE